MGIPPAIVDDLMVKCGRCCCICRRFKPLHLQVHHIVERADGGDDSPDNLIPICLTCHSDVHVKPKLTRRFTEKELKMQRDAVFERVANQTLVAGDDEVGELEGLTSDILSRLEGRSVPAELSLALSAGAVEQLLRVIETGGTMLDLSDSITDDSDIREISRVKAILEELEDHGLMAYVIGSLYRATHEGYLLADQLLAAGSELWGQDEDSRQVYRQLQDRQTFEFDGIALEDVIMYISEVAGVNVHVKWAFLNAAGVSEGSEVGHLRMLDVKVEKVLRVVLDDVAGIVPLGFYVDQGVITITTKSDLAPS